MEIVDFYEDDMQIEMFVLSPYDLKTYAKDEAFCSSLKEYWTFKTESEANEAASQKMARRGPYSKMCVYKATLQIGREEVTKHLVDMDHKGWKHLLNRMLVRGTFEFLRMFRAVAVRYEVVATEAGADILEGTVKA